MANKRTSGTRSALIRCPNCGEDYSVTYKRCPFCDEKAEEERLRSGEHPEEPGEGESHGGRGGRRLAGSHSHRGAPWTPLRIAGTVIPLAIIAAAIWIVVTQIVPLVNRGEMNEPPVSTDVVTTQPVEETTSPTDSAAPEDTVPPETSDTSAPTVPADQTATGFTLNREDFTMNDSYPDPVQLVVTFQPDGTTGTITWSSSDPDVASVDENGVVSHGTVRGTATITATMAGGVTQTCLVYNQVTSGTSSSSGGSSGATSSGTLSLNHTDFTFSALDNPSVQMRVNGTSSTPTWSIGNSAVATISADGVVRPAGSGTTTITCTVDGQTLTCIVRCTF